MKRAAVVVLGGLGQSPRMQYQSLSLSRHDYHVDFIGYDGGVGAQPREELLQDPNIRLCHLTSFPSLAKTAASLHFRLFKLVFYLLAAPIKLLFQFLQLFWVLLSIPKPDFFLLQV